MFVTTSFLSRRCFVVVHIRMWGLRSPFFIYKGLLYMPEWIQKLCQRKTFLHLCQISGRRSRVTILAKLCCVLHILTGPHCFLTHISFEKSLLGFIDQQKCLPERGFEKGWCFVSIIARWKNPLPSGAPLNGPSGRAGSKCIFFGLLLLFLFLKWIN